MYRSGTPRDQNPAVARWHAHLRGLATAIHEISGLAKTGQVIGVAGTVELKWARPPSPWL
jgi:hypothetical protein